MQNHLQKTFGLKGHRVNIQRIGFVAGLVARQGGTIICAAISPYREAREQARKLSVDNFVEVYGDTPIAVCEARDLKGLYARARAGEHAFARSLPLARALHPDTLLAWQMNDEPLPGVHGAPLRAIVPGWYAMDSVKWLAAVEVVAEPFRGVFQELDYRFLLPGEPEPGVRLAALPVHALIVDPAADAPLSAGRHTIRGIAWGGQGGAAAVHISEGEGPWAYARLGPAAGPYAWRTWEADVELAAGDRVLAVRARDASGAAQPEQPAWNQRGYANNGMNRVRVRVD